MYYKYIGISCRMALRAEWHCVRAIGVVCVRSGWRCVACVPDGKHCHLRMKSLSDSNSNIRESFRN